MKTALSTIAFIAMACASTQEPAPGTAASDMSEDEHRAEAASHDEEAAAHDEKAKKAQKAPQKSAHKHEAHQHSDVADQHDEAAEDAAGEDSEASEDEE